MKKSIKISGLLSTLLLVAGGAHAAGLGKLSVQSALGQPLRAEIELLSVSKEELPGVSARLANQELFRQARVERSGALGALEFEVAQRPNGQPVVRITSSAPMSEPFVDMLIELNWSTGRIIREYTILLDPPTEARTSTQPATAKPVPTAASFREAAPAEAAKTPVEAAKSTPKPTPQPSRYGPVKAGETLRSIAGRVRSTDVTLEQMMVGLYLSNKTAFIDSNMNLLKKGAVLNVPAAESVHLQTSPANALRMVQKHAEEWHAYRSKVAEVAGAVPETKPEGRSSAGRITPKVEDKAATPAPTDVLKLSKGEPSAAGKTDAKTQERLQTLEEELAAKSRALEESQNRVIQLEKAVQDMQKLLQMKSQETAKQAALVPEVPAPTPAQPAEQAPAPAPVPLAPPAPVEEEGSWLTTFLKNPIYIGGLVAAGLLSGLLWMMMVGSRRRQGLNKFEDSIMTGGEFKSGAVFNTGGTPPAVTGGATNTEGSMLLTDFSRLGLGAIDTHEVDPIAEAEVYMAYGRDAQAEEILKEALEKDSSRHEIALKLLEIYAARKDPLAFETTASELYAGLGGQDTPVWQRAADMGRSIDPENPLYRMTQGRSFATTETAVAEPPVKEPAPAPAAADDLSLDFATTMGVGGDREAPAAAQDNSLDFTSAFEAPMPQETADEAAMEFEAPAGAEALSMEFAPAPEEAAPEAEPQEVPEFSVAEMAMPEEAVPEFQALSEAEPEQMAATEVVELELPELEALAPATEPMTDLDFSSIDLDLEAVPPQEAMPVAEVEEIPAAAEMAQAPVEESAAAVETAPEAGIDPALWEEVNTKLDLARAYLEMGDREGAREILHEVVQEGDDKQKAEAEKLLSEAG